MNKKWLQLLLAMMCMAVIFVAQETKVEAAGTTYYVDSMMPDDSGDGTSPETAWKSLEKVSATTFAPGDQILFKAGGSWNGQLHPKGSGISGSPIVIDRYGTGNKPIINGNGISANPDATGGAAVYLYNQEYWEIRNLEVTNTGATAALRYGVSIVAADYGTAHYIHLINLTVHDVNGINTDRKNGGISLQALGSAVSTAFDDVLIDGCTVYAVDRTGITLHSKWMNRGGLVDSGPWNPWTNVIVQNNNVYDIGGDGILVRVAQSPLIQYNTSHDVNVRAGDHSAGIWVFNTDDAILQYNEAYLTRTTLDGQGFDADYNTNRTIIQYNYSHDNEGGFLLIITPGSTTGMFNNGTIVRYNISQNDKARLIQVFGPVKDAAIYNNTLYVGPGLTTNLLELNNQGGFPDGTSVKNNIFYNLGSGVYSLGNSTNTTFDSNVFYGNHPASEPSDPNKLTSDPMLVNPGSGGIGRHSTDGYQLLQGSPAIDSGTTITGNGGKDYWGQPVPHQLGTDRGAYEGPGIELTPGSVLFEDDFEDGNADSWTTPSGTWAVVADGTNLALRQSNGANEALAFSGGGWANYTYSANVKLTNNSANAGLTFRAINANNYYMFRLNHSTKAVELYKKVNGTLTLLSSAAFQHNINQWYALKVTVSGNQITGYVDDTEMIQWTNANTELSSGFIGFRMHGSTANFDDVLVTSNIVMQDSIDEHGQPQKGIWSFYPTLAAIHTSSPVQITDPEGNTDTYTPLNGKVYVSLTREPIFVRGDLSGVVEDTTFSLLGADTLSGKSIPLVFRMTPLSAVTAPLMLQVEGQTHNLPSEGEQPTEAILSLSHSEGLGPRWITAYMLHGSDKFALLRTSVQIREPYQVELRPVVDQSEPALLVSVRNHSSVDDLEVRKVSWKLGDTTGEHDLNVTVPPDSLGTYVVPLADMAFGVTYAAEATVVMGDSRAIKFTGAYDFNPIYLGSRTIDGVIDPELTEASPTIDLSKGKVVMGNYGGSSDLGGQIWLHYDEEHFYLSARIKDNVNDASFSAFDIWRNDSIQFAISEGLPGESGGYYEYGISQTPAGPQIYRFITPNGDDFGLVENGQLAITRHESEQETVYELALPWSELSPSKPLPNGVISFSMLVNDNDGSGRRGYVEWGSGIGSGKNPEAFRTMQWIVVAQTSEEAKLSELQVDGVGVTGFSSGDAGPYIVHVPHERTAVSITAIAVSPDATIQVTGGTELAVGDNTVTVTVTAEAGNTRRYELRIKRASAPAAGDPVYIPLPSPEAAGPEGDPVDPEEDGESTLPEEETAEEVGAEFSDTARHWAAAAIRRASALSLVSGYADGTFRPDRSVTRAEFTVMLIRGLQPSEAGEALVFIDASDIGAWARPAVAQALALGIQQGYEDGSFRPRAAITRAEAAVMLARAFKVATTAEATSDFADDAAIPRWAKGAIAALEDLDVVHGRDGYHFLPQEAITRAEAAALLVRMLE